MAKTTFEEFLNKITEESTVTLRRHGKTTWSLTYQQVGTVQTVYISEETNIDTILKALFDG